MCYTSWQNALCVAWLNAQKVKHIAILSLMFLNCLFCSHANFFNDRDAVKLCSREPPGLRFERIRGDGGFKIQIDEQNDIQLYESNRMYRVSISAVLERELLNAYMVAVSQNHFNENVTIGTFHITDGGYMGFDVACSHIVVTVGSLPKAEVHVMWTAPAPGTGCVEFRATVVESPDVWYKDDGGLTKVLCENLAGKDSFKAIGISQAADCCACGTAKYQLTFQSLWTGSSHKFPNVNVSQLHWSPLVGSSHGKHYTMWQFGSLASAGVRDVCQFGDTRALEDDIRHQSSNIRTVIKTSGIRWMQEHGLQQQRWAHFSVDHNHHLLSVLSRLSPSPDWCIGSSSLDLCLANCSWLSDTTIRLFAWDAGIVDGEHYTSEKLQSDPVQPIHRLPDRLYSSPSVPFHRSKVVEPMALLRLHRFDPKPDDDMSCSHIGAITQDGDPSVEAVPNEDTDDNSRKSCKMRGWSSWSACSTSCGPGVRTRSRTPVEAGSCADVVRMQSTHCTAADCQPHCELYDWSEWSTCSDGFVLCSSSERHSGTCFRRRTRLFQTSGADRSCNQTVEEEEPCMPSTVGILEAFDTNRMRDCFPPPDAGLCWGNIRRWYYDAMLNKCRMFLYGGCRGNGNRYRSERDCLQACSSITAYEKQHPVITESSSREIFPADVSAITALPNVGITPSAAIKHSHGSPADCLMSPWSVWSSCSATCGRQGFRTRSRAVRRQPSDSGRKCPRQKRRRRRCSMPQCVESSECDYSEWSSWSPCAMSCGTDSVQERIQRATGRIARRSSCPVRLQRRLCTLPPCV